MHDPMTVAHEIKYPWVHSRHNGHAYRAPFITIWHVDPELHGDDDSCGFSFPKIPENLRKRIKDFAFWEGHDPYYLRSATKEWQGSMQEAECLYRSLVLLTARALDIRMSVEEATLYAIERIHNSGVEGAARVFCWLPGYHCNGEDHPQKRSDHLAGIMRGIASDLLRKRRRWWQHPRWHIHHWKIQVHPLQQFKRWAFSRCAGCGNGFSWGYCPTSNQWDSGGPRWFRNEPHSYHSECCGKSAAAAPTEA